MGVEKLLVSPHSRGKCHKTKLSPIFAVHRCKSCPSYKKMLWLETLRKRSLLPLRATEAQGDCGSVLEKSQNCRKRPSPRLFLSLHDNFSLYHGERGEAGVENRVLHVENRVQGAWRGEKRTHPLDEFAISPRGRRGIKS